MQIQTLKSKIHRATVTSADIDYEGSIEIAVDLMEAAGLVSGEKVIVASITKGGRLETYVQEGVRGSGDIIINGGAAHLIGKGEKVAIMAFAWSKRRIAPKKILLGEGNQILESKRS